jgi:hypothetical protein
MTPNISRQTIPPTPAPIGSETNGRKIRDTSASGNARAEAVTAAYMAPEAPREGAITACGGMAAIASALVVVDARVRSRAGNLTRVDITCET